MSDLVTRLVEVVDDARKVRKFSGADYIDWKEVCERMAEEFPSEYNSKERWRSAYRRATSEKWKGQHDMVNLRTTLKRAGATTLAHKLRLSLKTKKSLENVVNTLDVSEDEIFSEVTKMRLAGIDVHIWLEDGTTWLQIKKKEEVNNAEYKNLYEGSTFKIALISDTHFGHNKNAVDELKQFYDYACSQGVTEFFHAGDITDGYYKNRDDSIYEQYAIGFDQQVRAVVDNYPQREGITTYFITGNHDTTHTRNGGANIGRVINQYRSDLVYLGHNFAKIWLTDVLDLNLVHPGDGSAYSVSHRAQKIIDGAAGKRKSKILAIGHYHKMDYLYWKGTHAFTMPSFQHQTGFMESKNLKSYVGGFILEIKADRDGELLTVKPEFVDLGGE